MRAPWFVCSSAFTAGVLLFACTDSTSPPVQGNQIVLGAHSAFLLVGDTFTLTATVHDHNGNPIPTAALTWSSSAPNVLFVSAAGQLHGINQGSARITVSGMGARDTATFDVSSMLVQLSKSFDNECVTSSTGRGYCRGDNFFGELGNGTVFGNGPPSLVFVAVSGGHAFREVLSGVEFTCGLTTDSLAWCWGLGEVGSLGTGDTITHTTPVPVSGGIHFSQLSTDGQSACGFTATGATYCWGWGAAGENGDSSGANVIRPQLLSGGLQLASVSTSLYSSCGVTTGHAAYCWGLNNNGMLGSVTDTVFTTPTPLGGGHKFASVSGKESFTCGLATDGTVYCWGLGITAPAALAGNLHFTELSTDFYHACGVTTDSVGYCWMAGSQSDLGAPIQIPGNPKILHIGAGYYHDCAILADSTASCWLEHCGVASDVGCNSPGTQTGIAGGRKFTSVVSSDAASCGTSPDSTAACWVFDIAPFVSPEASVPGFKATSLSMGGGGDYPCAIGADSLGYCWAVNGYADSVSITTPTVLPGGHKYSSLNTGDGYICGIASGIPYCWTISQKNPATVPGASGFVSVNAGATTHCGIKTDSSVSCWGSNSDGELGLGYASGWSAKPLAVSGGHAFTTIAAADDHACGLLTDSTAYCWGSGHAGTLGTGDTLSGATPRAVNTSLRFGSLSLGSGLSCGLTGDGSAYCWGRGTLTPAAQQSGTKFRSLGADGYTEMCGLTVAGAGLCWGVPPSPTPLRTTRGRALRFASRR